jgi:hypothetical protein
MRPILEASDIQCLTTNALIDLIIAQIYWKVHMDQDNSMHILKRVMHFSRVPGSSMIDPEEVVGTIGFSCGVVIIDVVYQNFPIFH